MFCYQSVTQNMYDLQLDQVISVTDLCRPDS